MYRKETKGNKKGKENTRIDLQYKEYDLDYFY